MVSVDSRAEQPVFFPAGEETLFGMLTRPPGEANGVGVLLIQGGDTLNVSMLRNRLSVRLARTLAARGYHALRFDYHGLGESSGELGELYLDAPLSEDAAGAASYLLSQRGVERLVLVGACFSARTALATASSVADLAGVVLVTPPVAGYSRSDATAERMARDASLGDYARRALRLKVLRNLADPARRDIYVRFAKSKVRRLTRQATGGRADLSWVSARLLEQMGQLARRRVPVMIVYGMDDPLLREFDRAREGQLGAIIEESKGRIEVVRTLPGVIHGFPSVASQQAFLELAPDWIDQRCLAREGAER